MNKNKFYHNGLRFTCTECGQCCTHSDGFVQVTEEEACQIARYKKISEAEFLENFVECIDSKNQLILKSHQNGDCIFLINSLCSVYDYRPRQCCTYPFWPENIKSLYRWLITAKECPGINQGKLFTIAEIEEIQKQM